MTNKGEQVELRKIGKKKCTKCLKILLLEEFFANTRVMKSGNICHSNTSRCKFCIRKANTLTDRKEYKREWKEKKSKKAPIERLDHHFASKTQAPKDKNYISNNKLYFEIVISKAQGKLTRRAENMLILICNKLINKMFYKNKQDKEDCLSVAYLDVFKNWYLFEEFNNNPFAYYSEIVKRGLARSWNQLKKRKGLEGYEGNISLDTGNKDGMSFYNQF